MAKTTVITAPVYGLGAGGAVLGSTGGTWSSSAPHHIPQNMFRYGETALHMRAEIPSGSHPKGGLVRLQLHERDAVDVMSVHTEVYARTSQDLEAVLWSLALNWDFVGCFVPIGPISHFGGGLGDVQALMNLPDLPPGTSEIEQILHAAKQGEWDRTVQDFRLGQGHLFRGCVIYRHSPVAIPANTQAEIVVKAEDEINFMDRVKLKIVLGTKFRSVIEIA